MYFVRKLPLIALLLAAVPAAPMFPGTDAAKAGETMTEHFENQPEERWRFIADQVMGGVSTGALSFVEEDGRTNARLKGSVSTQNNGGFIQMRMLLPEGAPEGSTGVRLVVRGNDQTYFVHLRSRGTLLPWQFYQQGFDVTGDWMEVRLPFDGFRRKGLPAARPRADSLTSIGIVAYGRDHEAEIDVREVGFY
jgi:hypothetical protein